VDFDNTLVTYDELMLTVALERGLVPATSEHAGIQTKKAIRDSIRELPGGEIEWQKVQAAVYGPLINQAVPSPGAAEFLSLCARQQSTVYIVSHKTEFASYDDTGTDLRKAALGWIQSQGFLDEDKYGINPCQIFFETTRKEKLERIGKLGCSYFIDDLEETFLEESFPSQPKKILFSPGAVKSSVVGLSLTGGWEEIGKHIFQAANR
jgi:hypothetical protein